MDPKRLVRDGYDRIGEGLAAWGQDVGREVRDRYTSALMDRLSEGARVLELGCGTGRLTTGELASRFRVTGVDISPRSVAAARRHVPNADFICADMASLAFAAESFDAVIALYSIIHLPRDEHPALLRSIFEWLRPGGLFVASMGARDNAGGSDDDWLGGPMYWSHFDSATNRRLVESAGFRILSAAEETQDEFDQPATFLWVVAEKESTAATHPPAP